jgi:hypothetical protein
MGRLESSSDARRRLSGILPPSLQAIRHVAPARCTASGASAKTARVPHSHEGKESESRADVETDREEVHDEATEGVDHTAPETDDRTCPSRFPRKVEHMWLL